ncbi:MAG: HEAT repeat domain-containing protein [Lentisphaerae bacterium]|nr:HEAT repeat domain-containing protein [Lentisphaerota bacterium]
MSIWIVKQSQIIARRVMEVGSPTIGMAIAAVCAFHVISTTDAWGQKENSTPLSFEAILQGLNSKQGEELKEFIVHLDYAYDKSLLTDSENDRIIERLLAIQNTDPYREILAVKRGRVTTFPNRDVARPCVFRFQWQNTVNRLRRLPLEQRVAGIMEDIAHPPTNFAYGTTACYSKELAAAGSNAVPFILRFKPKEPYARRAIINALAAIGDPRAADYIIEVLKIQDDAFRSERPIAASSLAQFDGKKVIQALIEALKDETCEALDRGRSAQQHSMPHISRVGRYYSVQHAASQSLTRLTGNDWGLLFNEDYRTWSAWAKFSHRGRFKPAEVRRSTEETAMLIEKMFHRYMSARPNPWQSQNDMDTDEALCGLAEDLKQFGETVVSLLVTECGTRIGESPEWTDVLAPWTCRLLLQLQQPDAHRAASELARKHHVSRSHFTAPQNHQRVSPMWVSSDGERNVRYFVEDTSDWLALNTNADITWIDRCVLLQDIAFLERASGHRDLHRAVWAEALERLTPGKQFAIADIPSELLHKHADLWKAVALMDAFGGRKGWDAGLAERGAVNFGGRLPAWRALLADTNLTAASKDVRLWRELSGDFRDELLDTVVVSLLLDSEYDRARPNVMEVLNVLLEKGKYHRSVVRWFSLSPHVSSGSPEARTVLRYFQKEFKYHRSDEPLKDALLRLVALKGRSADEAFVEQLEEGAVPTYFFRTSEQVSDDLLYARAEAVRFQLAYRRIQGDDRKIEYLLTNQLGHRDYVRYFAPALDLASHHYPEEIMWQVLNDMEADAFPRSADRVLREMARGVRKNHPKYALICRRLSDLASQSNSESHQGIYFDIMQYFEDYSDMLPAMLGLLGKLGETRAANILLHTWRLEERLEKCMKETDNASYRRQLAGLLKKIAERKKEEHPWKVQVKKEPVPTVKRWLFPKRIRDRQRMPDALAVWEKLYGWDNPAAGKAVAKAQPPIKKIAEHEYQWRQGLDGRRCPLLEIFHWNRTSKPVRLSKVQFNGQDIIAGSNGVAWARFYPSSECLAGRSVAFQMSLSDMPSSNLIVAFFGDDGVSHPVTITPLNRNSSDRPNPRITDFSVATDGRYAFIAWLGAKEATVKTAHVNGVEVTHRMRQLARPGGHEPMRNSPKPEAGEPGWVRVCFDEQVKQGDVVHVRLGLSNGDVVQHVQRAMLGVSLDSFAIDEHHPSRRLFNFSEPRKVEELFLWAGRGEALEPERRAGAVLCQVMEWQESGEEALVGIFMDTMASPSKTYPVYGHMGDYLDVSIPREEQNLIRMLSDMHWGHESARPKPWGWLLEAPLRRARAFLPQEFRLLSYSALGQGARGIHCFTPFETSTVEIAYTEHPALKDEIVRINGEIKRLEPLLSIAASVGRETTNLDGHNIFRHTLWCGDAGMMVIVGNLDVSVSNPKPGVYEFQATPITHLEMPIRLPSWLTPPMKDGVMLWQDLATGRVIPGVLDNNGRSKVRLPDFNGVQALWLFNLNYPLN